MEEESKLGASMSNIRDLDEIKKLDRYYLRYYLTVKRARELNQRIYKGQMDKSGNQQKTAHPIRIACLTEQIKNQKISEYHMNWLVALLHDSKEDDLMMYSENIDEVLKDLLPEQKSKILDYIDQLTSEEWKSKGEKKEDQIKKMEIMDLVPSWIRVFDKYDNCRRFKKNPVGNSKKKLEGYFAIAYLCYHIACERHQEIQKNLQPQIHEFYGSLCSQLGGYGKLKKIAEDFINEYK